MSEESAPPPAGGQSKKALVIVGIAALLLGAGGGFAGASMASGSEEAPAEEAAAGHGEAPAAEAGGHGEAPPAAAGGHGEAAPADGHGGGANAELKVTADGSTMIALGAPFTLNLRGSGGGRVLRMEVQIEGVANDAGAITARIPQIRDTILVATSDYSWAELEGTDGKTRLRDELLARVNGVVTPLAVNRLYFTQFVVQ